MEDKRTSPFRQHLSAEDGGNTTSKGKERATDDEQPWLPTGLCHLSALPPELIDQVLSLLSPVDLAAVSCTCRDLNRLATADNIWKPLVQANVPGILLSSPSPCATFRDLYVAHDLRWFVPKHKLWFCDHALTGKLIVTRFDPRTGNIEGYQLVTIRPHPTHQTVETWEVDDDNDEPVLVYLSEPRVKLHIDRPIIRFKPVGLGRTGAQEQGGVSIMRIPVVDGVALNPLRDQDPSSQTGELQGFRVEMPFKLDEVPGDLDNALMLSRPLPPETVAQRMAPKFPYGNVWPPPPIPADHRVAGTGGFHTTDMLPFSDQDIPSCRDEMTTKAFRIRTCAPGPSRVAENFFSFVQGNAPPSFSLAQFPTPWPEPDPHSTNDVSSVTGTSSRMRRLLRDNISTYSTLDAALYTPTPRYPYRGIWVGDYGSHGCEFLLFHQPERPDEDEFNPDLIPRLEGETDEDYAQRKVDTTVNRGRLEAIKLTGDPNVPRGEYTFIADDLGPGGFIRNIHEAPFHGARAVKSRGHVAGSGFTDDQYMETQFILHSHDRLAQYWIEFRHVNFFQRVNIDDFIKI